MRRWLSQNAVRTTTASLRQFAGVVSSGAASAWSRTTIWIDGEHARVTSSSTATGATTAPVGTGEISSALKALDVLAPKPVKPGLHMVSVLVGAPFARYFVLPWQPLARPVDWISLARVQFLQTGGGNVDGWRFVVSDGPWGASRLAAAVPEALYAGITHVCKQRRLKLLGIEPAYTFALSKHSRRIRDGAIAVAELEQTEAGSAIAHIGMRRNGQWTGFIALPVPTTVDDVLRDALVLCAASSPERLYVIGSGRAERWVAEASRVEWLPAPWDGIA